MLTLYVRADGKINRLSFPDLPLPLPPAVWIDLRDPTMEEIEAVQAALNLELPTRDEMQEIELSSRLYDEGEAIFMTFTMVAKADTETPETQAVTVMVSPQACLTLRYTDPVPFTNLAARLLKQADHPWTPDMVFISLGDAIVDRAADILERTSYSVDGIARQVFDDGTGRKHHSDHLKRALTAIGRNGTLISEISESMMSLTRAITFFSAQTTSWISKHGKQNIKTLARDVKSLHDHSAFLSQKTNFLLDATLGMISIEQNNIVKIFTVAAAAFLPPTLIASIYGMNFEFMPELKWQLGYPLAILLMILSSVIPFAYFRRRGWL